MKDLKTLLIALAGLLVAAFLAWGPRGQTAQPKNRIVVQYWEKWTGNEAEQMKQIVRDFNESVGREKNIYVEYLSMSNVNQKTLVATAAGVPPDIAGLWNAQVVQFAAKNALEPWTIWPGRTALTRTITSRSIGKAAAMRAGCGR
jgi:ABC-type glycerol-3-phosphate transport system substrate-binding protein